MVTSSKRLMPARCTSQDCCSQSSCPWIRSVLSLASTGDTQRQIWLSLLWRSLLLSLGLGAHEVLFLHFKHLWQVWGLILKRLCPSPLLSSCWGFSFALGHGVSFLVGSSILLLMVVQQLVAILVFSQKMSAHLSTQPSWLTQYANKFGKLSSGHRPGKGQFSF